MKESTTKFETSAFASNLMLASAVIAAASPVLLGDRLELLASGFVTQATILIQSISISLERLLS